MHPTPRAVTSRATLPAALTSGAPPAVPAAPTARATACAGAWRRGSRPLGLAALVGLCAVGLASQAAALTPRYVTSGPLTLPLSGFAIDLPAEDDVDYRVESYYRVDGGGKFAARDAITRIETVFDGWDEDEVWTESVWVQHGKITDGGCAEFVAKESLDGATDAPIDAWGLTWKGRVGTLKVDGQTFPSVVVCTTRDDKAESLALRLIVRDAPASTPRDAVLGRFRSSDLAKRIADAYRTERVAVDPPLLRSEVGLFTGAPPVPKRVTLPFHKVALDLPSDGFAWTTDTGDTKPRESSDFISSVFPSASDLGVELRQVGRGPCEGAYARSSGTFVATASVGAWSGERVKQGDRFHEAWLCKALADRAIVARVTAKADLGELARYLPILDAAATALATLPAPPARPGPPKPWTPTRNPKDFVHIAVGLEGVYSSRDTGGLDPVRFPETRLAGPGFSMKYLWNFDGFLGRMDFAATFDLGGLFDDQKTSAARWGAQHLEFAFEMGFAFGDDLRFGLMAGWTGMSGPLTLNSSLSVSAMIAMPPEEEDELGWILRVTPVNLFAANERTLMSPLAVDLDFAVGGLGFGAEFQHIAAPEIGDEDIPAAGWALLFRFGIGGFLNRF